MGLAGPPTLGCFTSLPHAYAVDHTDPMRLFLPVWAGGNSAPLSTARSDACKAREQQEREVKNMDTHEGLNKEWLEAVERDPDPPTKEEIEEKRTEAGGWTRETLAAWGVSWPPPKGWKKNLLAPLD